MSARPLPCPRTRQIEALRLLYRSGRLQPCLGRRVLQKLAADSFPARHAEAAE